LFPAAEPMRHQALKVGALATGISEKAVSLFYERALHKETSEVWIRRCGVQINGALAELETNRKKHTSEYWFGNTIGHADIAVACALRFIPEAHPGLIAMAAFPALRADAARLEALPAFQTIAQRFIPPA
jgi:glutathione S-transferase